MPFCCHKNTHTHSHTLTEEIESDEDALYAWIDVERMIPGVSLDEAMRGGIRAATVAVLFLDEQVSEAQQKQKEKKKKKKIAHYVYNK